MGVQRNDGGGPSVKVHKARRDDANDAGVPVVADDDQKPVGADAEGLDIGVGEL